MQPVKKLQFWYQKPILWIAIGVFGCLGLLAMPHAQKVYHHWTGGRKLKRAEVAHARGDYKEAILNARGVLATDSKNVEALRIMARTAEAMGANEAIQFRRQLDAIRPQDPENLLGMAELSFKAGDPGAAEALLKGIPQADRASSRYHSLSARVALNRRNSVAAEFHAVEALKFAPQDEGNRFRLATLQLSSQSPETRDEGRKSLMELSDSPTMRSSALRTLITDAQMKRLWDRTLELADALAASNGATFSDKLVRLTVLYTRKDSEYTATNALGPEHVRFSEELGRLQEAAKTNSDDLLRLLTWMNEHNHSLLALEWAEVLPPDVTAVSAIRLTLAEALARASQWSKLKESIEGVSWEKLDFFRSAFLARALDRLGDPNGADSQWNRALELSAGQPGGLESLASEVTKWGWEQRTQEALWKLASKGQTPRWAVDALWASALKKNETADLYKVSKLLLEAEPKRVEVRNYFVRLSLLTGQSDDSTHLAAEALHTENPANAVTAATYGLSLYQQGKPEAAVALMARLLPENKAEPSFALYYGIFLAASGQPDEAEGFLTIGASAPQLPEIKAITGVLESVFKAKACADKGDQAGSRKAWSEAIPASRGRVDLLEILGRVSHQWGWEDQAGEALLMLAELGRCPAWATDRLWAATLERGDPGQLYNVSKLILGAAPKSIAARINFLTLALLTGRESETSHRLAEELHKQHPESVEATVTYSLSLYRLGKTDQALQLLRGCKPEQLLQPRNAFYHGVVLAASGEFELAEKSLQLVANTPLLPEEKVIFQALNAAFEWRALTLREDQKSADAAWNASLKIAGNRSDLLETLAKIALKFAAPEKAESALWKLAEGDSCQEWVISILRASAKKRGNTAQLYQLSRLARKAEPQNLKAQNEFIWLSLLSGQEADSPHRLAEALHERNPRDAEVVLTYSLSLFQRDKIKEAIGLVETLKPEQIREKIALYYGIYLTASGKQTPDAVKYLQLASTMPLLSEEKALLGKVGESPETRR